MSLFFSKFLQKYVRTCSDIISPPTFFTTPVKPNRCPQVEKSTTSHPLFHPDPPQQSKTSNNSSSSTRYLSPRKKTITTKPKTLKSIRRPVRQQTADDDAAHTEKKKWKGHEEEWPLIGSPPIPITLSHPHHPQSNFICVIVDGAMTGFFSLCHSPRPPSTSFYYFFLPHFCQ